MSEASNSRALAVLNNDESPNATNSTDSTQHSSVILDSLPYIDNIHPDYEAYALTLIEEEMQTMSEDPSIPIRSVEKMTHLTNPLGSTGSAESVPITFLKSDRGTAGNEASTSGESESTSTSTSKPTTTSINQVEYEQLVQRNGQPRPNPINFSQTTIATPPSDKAPAQTWHQALQQAKIELEHERLRLLNNELQSEYETNLWKYYNQTLESCYVQPLQSSLQTQRQRVDQLNAKRKELQEGSNDNMMMVGGSGAAQRLHVLNGQWSELVGRNQRLANATAVLEEQVQQLRESVGEVGDAKSGAGDEDQDQAMDES